MRNKEKLNHKIARYKHQQLLHSYYGFHIDEVSHQNLQKLRQALAVLSTPEKIIFEKLITSFTLKHATNAAKEIVESGKMFSVRALEKNGVPVQSHSSGKDGHDQSIFFVFGLGDHKTPKFLQSATHEVTIDLYQLLQHNPDAGRQLWVSGHLTEFQAERTYIYTIGNATLQIKHSKDKIKSYLFTQGDGKTIEFQQQFQDEIFTGYDVLAGIAFKFIQLLRLLGGDNNPVINNLYRLAESISSEFMPMLETLFSSLMPGDVYPETKIIKQLTIDPRYFQIKKRKTSDFSEWQYNAVKSAIDNYNFTAFKALLQMGYPCCHPDRNPIIDILEHRKFPSHEVRIRFLKIILENYYYDSDPSCINLKLAIIYAAGEDGNAADLDFLLSQKIPHSKTSGVYYSPSVHKEYLHSGSSYDLISIVCRNQNQTKEKLEVLQRHGADFNTDAYNHYIDAMYTNYRMKTPNLAAIIFLYQLGIRPVSQEITYNETPLMLACKTKDIALVRHFVEIHNVDINEPLRYRYASPLGFVTYVGENNGKTALDFAVESGATDIIDYLRSHGAQPGIRTEESGNTRNDNHLFRVVPVLIGTRRDNKPYVVLGKRRSQESDSILSNTYCFPGGEVDDTDASFEDAALRELFEETSVDARKIPGVRITHLATIDGFSDHEHKATVFYLIDVGSHPISVEASDDLIEARRVTVDQIVVSEAPTATFMGVGDTRILGSNALLVQYCLLGHQIELSAEQIADLKKQLLIEAQGCEDLHKIVRNNQHDIYPNSATWCAVESLLKNLAHLGYKYPPDDSLPILMLTANSFEGVELLKKYGVDITQRGVFKLSNETFCGTALYYALKINNIVLAKNLIALEPRFIDKKHGLNNMLLIACVENNNYEGIDYLISAGVDSNTSANNSRARPGDGSYIQRPLIATAIKKASVDLVRQLMSDRRIFINRERSIGDHNTTLMTAIKHDKKEIAVMLLADDRLDVSVKNKNSQTALMFAQGKPGWEDVVAMIEAKLKAQSECTLKNVLLNNTLETIDTTDGLLLVKENYSQLIRECQSLKCVDLAFAEEFRDELTLLIDSVSYHDNINTINFHCFDNDTLNSLLPIAIAVAKTFKSLKYVQCTDIPFNQLMLILSAEFNSVKSFTIYGDYSAEEIESLSQFLTVMKIQAEITLVDVDSDSQNIINSVVTRNQVEELMPHGFTTTRNIAVDLTFGTVDSINLQNKLELLHGCPTVLKLTEEFYTNYKTYVKKYLLEHADITSVTLSGKWSKESADEFLILLQGQSKLNYLELFSTDIDIKVMCVLSKILSTIPIQGLALQYSKFLMERPIALLKAINESSHLAFINCSDSTASAIIMSELAGNRSLLSADLSDWRCATASKEAFHRMLARNADAHLQPEYAATTAARFLAVTSGSAAGQHEVLRTTQSCGF